MLIKAYPKVADKAYDEVLEGKWEKMSGEQKREMEAYLPQMVERDSALWALCLVNAVFLVISINVSS